ncbi:MAG TPA: cytochrome C [Beijerinckiaceae bacterium]|jgi:cytochrome c553
MTVLRLAALAGGLVLILTTGATAVAAPGALASPGTLAPPGAAACSGCHAPSPRTSSVMPAIHGRPAAEIAAAMREYRAGTRPATVMDRIAKGFSEAETEALAAWLEAHR